jgi:hypothetical protein
MQACKASLSGLVSRRLAALGSAIQAELSKHCQTRRARLAGLGCTRQGVLVVWARHVGPVTSW